MTTLTQILLVKEGKLTPAQARRYRDLVQMGVRDPFLLLDEESVNNTEKRQVILYGHDEVPVGFISPHRQSMQGQNHWRAGAVFLDPKYRGKGIMAQVLQEFFATHQPGLAWIDAKNHSSQQLFKRLGFVQYKVRHGSTGQLGHWYVKPKKSISTENAPAWTAW